MTLTRSRDVDVQRPAVVRLHGTAGHVDGIAELCVPDLVLSDAGSGVAGPRSRPPSSPGVAQAATWDPATQRRLGRAIGAEAYAKGINVMLGPGMNIARTPYNGRNFEYLGEDPYLAASSATAFIRGSRTTWCWRAPSTSRSTTRRPTG